MIIVGDVLISNELIEEQFHCNLESCKGACCWDGDFGAPVNRKEQHTIMDLLPKIKPYLSKESLDLLKSQGPFTYYSEIHEYGTTLHKSGACVFLTKDENGISKCGIEQAFQNKEIDFRKPISCHLYPVRVTKNPGLGFEALNYDRWDICNAACSLGKKLKMPLYVFAKDAIIRAYGEAFYDELDAAAQHLKEES